jgi:hypothetical protein
MAFPTTSAPTLTAWQLSFKSLTMGPSTPYGYTQLDGMGLPNVISGDAQHPRDSGLFTGSDYLAGRDITISGDIITDGTSLQHSLTALAQVSTPVASAPSAESPLWIAVPNVGTIASMVRCRKRDIPFDITHAAGLASFAMQFSATDPRWYSAPTTVTRTGPGSVTITNAGNYETRPIITFTGPVSAGFTISNGTDTLTSTGGLASGDTLTIDLDTRTVMFDPSGSAVAYAARTYLSPLPGWFVCPAGSSTITFAGTGSTAGISVQYASAWMF